MAAFKIGDAVSIKHTTMTGEVKGAKLDEVSLEIQYLVAYQNNEGEDTERYFLPSQIEQ